jgi:glycosyltransferase involved in cell wall biosynthesis
MNNPLVSIIVPVYNVQNSVARCLESICAQTWKNIEVILVNDGSRDESFSICEQFREKDPRIVLVDKSNSGVSETRNCGMSLARGKYVQFVDSDDYLDPDFTERLVTAAEANNADLVIAPYWMVIPANSSKATQALENLQENLGIDAEKKPDDIREYGFLPEGIYDRDTFALRLMEKPASFFYSVLWNKLYRQDILADHHLQFTSEVRWAEDLVFNLEYILYANVFVSISKAGYHYVQNPQSICHTQINLASIVQNKLQVFRYYGPALIKRAVRERDFSAVDFTLLLCPFTVLGIARVLLGMLFAACGFVTWQSQLNSLTGWTSGIVISVIGMMGLAALTIVAERDHVGATNKELLAYVLAFPIYMLSYVPISFQAVFAKSEWKPIEHKG